MFSAIFSIADAAEAFEPLLASGETLSIERSTSGIGCRFIQATNLLVVSDPGTMPWIRFNAAWIWSNMNSCMTGTVFAAVMLR